MRPLLLATCAAYPDGDADDRLLVEPLAANDVDARFAVWDDPAVDWSAPTVLRSTWDYTLRRPQFLDWITAVPQLHNAPEIVRWNGDKLYLAELERADLPITPTAVLPPGEAPAELPDAEFVVKPSVGAGSRGAGRFRASAHDDARRHIEVLHDAGRTALVQPYLSEVDEAGETALIYFAGVYSHAIRKGPMLTAETAHELTDTSGLFVEENIEPRRPSQAELDLGDRVLAFVHERFGAPPLYARVDLLPGPSGPVVIELELTEPSLFLSHADGAADRFAACIVAAIAERT